MTEHNSLSGTFTAVVDRIVDGETAVLLVEDGDDVISQLAVAVEQLPAQAQEGGGILQVELEDGDLVTCVYQAEETAARRQSIADRYESLSRNLSDE